MASLPPAIDSLITELSKLPSIGRKSAQRLAFHLMRVDEEQVLQLSDAIRALRERLRLCRICGNVTEGEECEICRDPRRDRTSICVVEQPIDVLQIEASDVHRGLYHVLHGTLSPLRGITADDLKIAELEERLDTDPPPSEVILALNPSVDGDVTATYLAQRIEERGISVTRLGTGVPVGGSLEYTDAVTLRRAFEGRRKI
ncbi:recombination protein RecR [Candidatus Sumerlaeota bacterium]|nr:recombination protein RecR [Candidatus Sumerlaeota bacterium]